MYFCFASNKVSITRFSSISDISQLFSSEFINPRSKGALCIIILLFDINSKKSTAISWNKGLSDKNSCVNP